MFPGLWDWVFQWLMDLRLRSLTTGRFLGSRREKASDPLGLFYHISSLARLLEAFVLGAWLLWCTAKGRKSLGAVSEGAQAVQQGRAQRARPWQVLRQKTGFLSWPAHSVWCGRWTLEKTRTHLENQRGRWVLVI